MAKFAIYTCIIDGYDQLLQPAELDPDFDFICFVRKGSGTAQSDGAWIIRELEEDGHDAATLSRLPKFCPDRYLDGYEACVWLDGNVRVAETGFYDRIRALFSDGAIWASMPHPQRDDVYEEGLRILNNGRDSLWNVLRVTRFLRREKFPQHWGLYENNVIYRRLGDVKVQAVGELWQSLFLSLCRRDQMSLTYCLWKQGVTPVELLPEGRNSRNTTLLSYVRHDRPYVKDKSLKGRFRDARTAVVKLIYRISLYL